MKQEFLSEKKHFVDDTFTYEIDVMVKEKMVDCRVIGYEFKKQLTNHSLIEEEFISNSPNVCNTNAITILERAELEELLERQLIAIELVLKDAETLILGLCFKAGDGEFESEGKR